MIDIGKILKRSWQILWNYRILWIFGFLLALTSGGGNGGNGGGSGSQAARDGNSGFPGFHPPDGAPWMGDMSRWFEQHVEPLFTYPEQHIGTFILIGVVIFLIMLFFGVITALVRYPSETAVIRMVDEYEHSGSKVGFRNGWKLGWTRRAFRLWVIDLILSLPVLVVVLLLLGVGLIVALNVSFSTETASVLAIVAAIGAVFLSVFLIVVVAVFLNLLRNFFARAAALENLGVIDSFKAGWGMFKRNWKSAGLMWLVMVGVGIGVGIAGIIVFFVLIPAYLVMLVPAAVVASLPGLLVFGLTSLFTSAPLTWIFGLLAALPLFFITLFAPLIFLGGWYEIYKSNIWTLTYREIKAKENLAAPGLPAESTENNPQS